MKADNKPRLAQDKRVFFEPKSEYEIEIKSKCKKNIAVVHCVFKPDGESVTGILEKLMKSVDFNN